MAERPKQQIGGLLLAAMVAGFTAWNWRLALTGPRFCVKAAIATPAVVVQGLAMVWFPTCREERPARGEDITRLQDWKMITPRWWAVLRQRSAAAWSTV